jgi:hypothetical protein
MTRVRDGYVSLSTCGHTRALPVPAQLAICRPNVVFDDRACTPVPPQNLHGKEGVDAVWSMDPSNRQGLTIPCGPGGFGPRTPGCVAFVQSELSATHSSMRTSERPLECSYD